MTTTGSKIDWKTIKERISRTEKALEANRDPQAIDALLKRRAQRYRRREDEIATDTFEVVVFERSQGKYAAPLASLTEIRTVDGLTELPGISSVIRGILNVRGQVVALHDLAALRGADASLGDSSWVLLSDVEETTIGLAADHVEGVATPRRDEIRPVPISLSNLDGPFRGIFDDDIVLVDFHELSRCPEFFQA